MGPKGGAAGGRNLDAAGCVHNTRQEDSKRADRHCFVPTRKGTMKCMRCFDYNAGNRRGVCNRCHFDRFSMRSLAAQLPGLFVDDGATPDEADLDFERRIEKHHRWSPGERRHVGANTSAVLRAVKDTFDERAVVHKEGSVRKNTEVRGSDVDLMMTLSGMRQMTAAERADVAARLRARADVFESVAVCPRAIKLVPHHGPAIDVVAHHSEFAPNYLRPAGAEFWSKAKEALAASGLKVWWFGLARPRRGDALAQGFVPGCAFENMALRWSCAPAQDTGLKRFLATIGILAEDVAPHAAMQQIAEVPACFYSQIHFAAKRSSASWATTRNLQVAFGI
ncbi:hypothetical protein M885DRAFT_562376 [Pelagophyceae sp. CCMP2097]|nr:hypothetical protein M885DRAFT_562376 [Pelagophyceae sp. CCMP2097]